MVGSGADLLAEVHEHVDLEGDHVHLVGPGPGREAQGGEAGLLHVGHALRDDRLHGAVVGAEDVGADGAEVDGGVDNQGAGQGNGKGGGGRGGRGQWGNRGFNCSVAGKAGAQAARRLRMSRTARRFIFFSW